MELEDFAILKQKYMPATVNVLFIGDGTPIKARHFYLKNSGMFRAVKAAFTQVFGDFESDDAFLSFFVEMGCYFENLSTKPIKVLPPAEQREARRQGVEPLSMQIKRMQPRLVIITLKTIEAYAREAIAQSGVTTIENVTVTPFPVKSMANVNNCINGIVSALKSVEWEF